MKPYQVFVMGDNTVDISDHVISLDGMVYKDCLYGLNSCQIMLNTTDGQFITRDNAGKTPILKAFDKIKIILTDDIVGDSTTKTMIIDSRFPQETAKGNQCQYELFGYERYLQRMFYSANLSFTNYKELIIRIINFYNSNRGTKQPQLKYVYAELDIPSYPVGNMVFSEGTNCLDALREIIVRYNLPVQAGGVGTLHTILFEDDGDDFKIRIFEQGSKPNVPKIITGQSTDVDSVTRTVEAPTANVVVLRGQEDSATLPDGISTWRSKLDFWENFPQFNPTVSYKAGTYVRWRNGVFKCETDTVPSPVPLVPAVDGPWIVQTLTDYLGDIQYSPWTQEKSGLWKNAGGNSTLAINANSFESLSFGDSNLEIEDQTSLRTEATMRVKSLEDIPEQYMYKPNEGPATIEDRLYEGFTIVVDPTLGALTGTLAGNDKNDIPYSNTVSAIDAEGDFIVTHKLTQSDQVAVMREGKVYEMEHDIEDHTDWLGRTTSASGALTLKPIHLAPRGNDCFHRPYAIANAKGLIQNKFLSDIRIENSAIKISYIGDRLVEILADIDGLRAPDAGFQPELLWSRHYYDFGWWAQFDFPFPKTTYNGITEDMGELIGGTIAEKIPHIDLSNITHTLQGSAGFLKSDSTDLSELHGLHFLFKYEEIVNDEARFGRGDLIFRVTMYDIFANVWIQDFTYRHLGDVQQIVLPFSGFRIYRARASIETGLLGSQENITTPELSIQNIFDTRKIKRICIQLQEVYDDDGRFSPKNYIDIYSLYPSQNFLFPVRMHGWIDGLCFIKTPLAIAKAESASEIVIMDQVRDFPEVANTEQLQGIAQAELELQNHINDAYIIKTDAKCDISCWRENNSQTYRYGRNHRCRWKSKY